MAETEVIAPGRRLAQNLVWFALGMIVTGVSGVVAFQTWLDQRIDGRLQNTEVVSRLGANPTLRAALAVAPGSPLGAEAVPAGSLTLFEADCPTGFQDLSPLLDGRYILVDNDARSGATLQAGSGAHEHDGGTHSHTVTGETEPLGIGEGTGSGDAILPHGNNRVAVSGVAAAGNRTRHNHSGGAHEHRGVGVRVCKAN